LYNRTVSVGTSQNSRIEEQLQLLLHNFMRYFVVMVLPCKPYDMLAGWVFVHFASGSGNETQPER
jgi:hypothetical protein